MSFEEAKEYLARALPWPQEGEAPAYVNVHWTFKPSNHVPGERLPWAGRAVTSVNDAIKAIEWAQSKPDTCDFYACMSTQQSALERTSQKNWKYFSAIRSQQNAVALKSLFIDIDAKGTDKNSYATLDDALVALGAFIAAVGLPRPSMVVMSGGGLHVYWTMARALTPAEWAPLAYALAEATKRHGLKCDTQCTVDSARVLRIPDTLNHKLAVPRPVRLAGARTDFDYSVERLATALKPYETIVPQNLLTPKSFLADPSLFPARAPITAQNDLSAGVDKRNSDPVDLNLAATECAFINEAITTGGKNYANPLWNLTTLIATFGTNGLGDAHRMADQHAGYTKESTEELYDRKGRERNAKGIGWPSCATISAQGSTHCATCKHFAAGRSPLSHTPRPPSAPQPGSAALAGAGAAGGAGSSLAGGGGAHGAGTPAGQPPGAVAVVVGQQAPGLWGATSDLPVGYIRGPTGLVYKVVTNPDGTHAPQEISDYAMTDPWVQRSPWALHFTTTTERGKQQQVALPFEAIGSNDMRKILQDQGFMVPVGPKGSETIARFFVAWIKVLQDTRDSVSSEPFGWQVKAGSVQGFVFGGHLWTPTGAQPAANPDVVIARHYAPTGDIAPWMAAAKLVTSQGRPQLDAIIASAFAAPLVRFTGQAGVLMSAYSTQSGIGKTTALTCAQAVWGDPVKAIQALTDTQNSVMGKLGQLRSLPLYWDEIKGDEDTKKFVSITFQTTQGKEKSRMTSRATQREPGSWQTLLVSASNDSVLHYVLNRTNTTTAGLYRIFEYVVEPALPGGAGQIEPSEAARVSRRINDNYGNVGLLYAQFLGSNFVQVEADMAAELKAIGAEVATIPDERFWIALIATITVGARYANKLGFTTIDEVALKTFMLDVLSRMRAERTSQPVDLNKDLNVSSILTQFMTAMRARHTLFTNRIHVGRGAPPRGMVKVAHDISRLDGIYMHVGIEDKLLRISSSRLGEWLAEKQISRPNFVNALIKELHMVKINGRLGAGAGAQITGGTEYLFQIDLTGSPLVDFIDGA